MRLRTVKRAPSNVSTSILAGAKALEKETKKLRKLPSKQRRQKATAVQQMANSLRRVTNALPKGQVAPAVKKAVDKAAMKAKLETRYYGIDPKAEVLRSTLQRTRLRTPDFGGGVASGGSGTASADDILDNNAIDDEIYDDEDIEIEEATEDDGYYEDDGSYYSGGGGGGGYYSTSYDDVDDTGVIDQDGYFEDEVYDDAEDEAWSEEDIHKAIQAAEGEIIETAEEAEGLFAKLVDMIQEHPVIATAIGAGLVYGGYRYWQSKKG